jgi:hypothetical protein
MSDEPKKRPRAWIGWKAWALIAAVTPMAYVLSIGLAYWLSYRLDPTHAGWPTVILGFVYTPILEGSDYFVSAKPILVWYVSLFVDLNR